eukprot:6877571-Pyramimonas_sp.AAC.2
MRRLFGNEDSERTEGDVRILEGLLQKEKESQERANILAAERQQSASTLLPQTLLFSGKPQAWTSTSKRSMGEQCKIMVKKLKGEVLPVDPEDGLKDGLKKKFAETANEGGDLTLKDDGFSLVTAEDYVLFRLEPTIVRCAWGSTQACVFRESLGDSRVSQWRTPSPAGLPRA